MKRRSVFELLALKEKLSIQKKSQNMNVLAQELGKTEKLRGQLDDAIEQTGDPAGEQLAGQLRSNSWYRGKMMEQREAMRNREEFLASELSSTRKDVAQARQRETRATQKAEAQWRAQQNAKEQRAEADLFGRRRG